MALRTPRAVRWTSTYDRVVISPPTSTIPVVTKHSHATREEASRPIASSSTASEIWSQILSGCPSPTLSEVKMKSPLAPKFSSSSC